MRYQRCLPVQRIHARHSPSELLCQTESPPHWREVERACEVVMWKEVQDTPRDEGEAY